MEKPKPLELRSVSDDCFVPKSTFLIGIICGIAILFFL